MKIGIIGTRGIPNKYGGFEQFAESLALYLKAKNHDVWVYNASTHPLMEKKWNDIHILRKYNPEDKIGTFAQFIYDFNCIWDSRFRKFDIILQLGYTSSAIWNWLLPGTSKIITNMDGLEWKRSKYGNNVKRFLKFSEALVVKFSDCLVADSIGIQEYLKTELKVNSAYIPYGVREMKNANEETLKKFALKPNEYCILIARMEPENNIETIIKGYIQSETEIPLLVIGGLRKNYGKILLNKFRNDKILFHGAHYDQDELHDLRFFSRMYFHGHSVGGTNPSLLEAMASEATICAHDNIFNKSILKENAYYFSDANGVTSVLNDHLDKNPGFTKNNLQKIKNEFQSEQINRQYEELFEKCLK